MERIDDPFADLTNRPTRPAPSAGATEEPGEPPVNVLVLGSDSRISAGDPSQWAYGAQRTDAIMIVQVSGDREDAFVMSIPRDSWVPIPGYGMAKINAAFSYGGPALMIQTVEDLTGVYIDHFAVTDFESFATITDALGGVRMNLPNGLSGNGVNLAPGEHVLNGEQALVYVRQRYNLSGGDFSRVQRQQNWMRGIMREVFEQEILKDVGRLTTFSSTVLQSV
ncbi:MAG: LytR family transcriptional regulator, partial [Actinobacteria bacterium]|nr:LytR family transcriptional regulator [Actinomycetota bacterium]